MTNELPNNARIEPNIDKVMESLEFRPSFTSVMMVAGDLDGFHNRFEWFDSTNEVHDNVQDKFIESHEFVMAVLDCTEDEAWQWLKEEGLLDS